MIVFNPPVHAGGFSFLINHLKPTTAGALLLRTFFKDLCDEMAKVRTTLKRGNSSLKCTIQG